MDDPKRDWPTRVLTQLQGPSSLGMGVSGGAVGFSASIIDPNAYLGVWMSVVFQVHVLFQFLSVGCGVVFAISRLKAQDVAVLIAKAKQDDALVGRLDALEHQSRRLNRIARAAIYAQMLLFFAGGVAFVCLVLMHFRHALYP
jgi:hypothetical protein